jgi:triacylglycerol lipase
MTPVPIQPMRVTPGAAGAGEGIAWVLCGWYEGGSSSLPSGYRLSAESLAVPLPRLPVVLVHGFAGLDKLLPCRRPAAEFFPGVAARLGRLGVTVLAPRLSPAAGVAVRAAELAAAVRDLGPVHLVGHSLGGLDARHAVTHLGVEAVSVTTLGTPHRGSPVADWAVRLCRTGAVRDLTTAACERFNHATPDRPGVRYFSVAGLIGPGWLTTGWAVPNRLVERAEGPNDGVVSAASAGWGEPLPPWPGDHLNLVNWPNRRRVRANAWPDRGADYLRLLGRLAGCE